MPSTTKKNSISLETATRKAAVLHEALPYLQAFREKVFVIKSGGAALEKARLRKQLLQDITFLHMAGIHVVLVHGGGPEISKQLRESGITPEFVHGLRVTPAKSLRIVKKALGQGTQRLVDELSELGARPKGMSAATQNILEAKKFAFKGEKDLGFVGEVTRVNTAPIQRLLKQWKVPVIRPLGKGKDGHTYNINADAAAAAIAAGLNAEKFVLVTDVKGVLKNPKKPTSLIPTLTAKEADKLIERGVIQGGMIPKTQACLHALRHGVYKTHMVDVEIKHGLLLEIFTDQGIGTQMLLARNLKK